MAAAATTAAAAAEAAKVAADLLTKISTLHGKIAVPTVETPGQFQEIVRKVVAEARTLKEGSEEEKLLLTPLSLMSSIPIDLQATFVKVYENQATAALPTHLRLQAAFKAVEAAKAVLPATAACAELHQTLGAILAPEEKDDDGKDEA
jgi:hypothetical protein